MSLGAGTLAAGKGNANASSASRLQHSLPANPDHKRIRIEDVEAYWSAKQTKAPTRLWGNSYPTQFHGVERDGAASDGWLRGEFWNCDSNIRIWGEHEIRRNMASANHDVHRHDQINRTYLPSRSGDGRNPLQTVDLEAWGFDLGARDRQGKLAPRDDRPLWSPVASSEQFRSERSFDRNLERIATYQRTLRKTASSPGMSLTSTLMPEDIGGEAGEHATAAELSVERAGRAFGSRSCRGWDRYDHCARREGAKMALGVHSPSLRSSPDAHPFKDNEMQPASIYTKRFKKGGEQALRKYEPRNTRIVMR